MSEKPPEPVPAAPAASAPAPHAERLSELFIGIAGIIAARTAKKLGSAVTLTLMSGYFFASVYHWNGMNWATSWPLALVAVGMGAVVEAIATRFMPYGKDDERIHLERERDHE